MIGESNLALKGALIAKFGTLTDAARAISSPELVIDQYRLSRIIHGRAVPRQEEKRVIAWKLQRSIYELFNADNQF